MKNNKIVASAEILYTILTQNIVNIAFFENDPRGYIQYLTSVDVGKHLDIKTARNTKETINIMLPCYEQTNNEVRQAIESHVAITMPEPQHSLFENS